MPYLIFETDLFFTDIPDDQLDGWFLGADCAGWLYARMLPEPMVSPYLDPTMEDWGWIMRIKVNEVVVTVCIWEYLDRQKNWILGISSSQKAFRKHKPEELRSAEEVVVEVLSSIVNGDERFHGVRWSEHDPRELPFKPS